MKIWDKGVSLDSQIESYTVGNDNLIDLHFLKYDCIASIAHAKMLFKIGVLTKKELDLLTTALNEIIDLGAKNKFKIEQSDEDCSSAIEKYLVLKCGDAGKKIHTARSRNDQILSAIRLYERDSLSQITTLSNEFIRSCKNAIKKWGNLSMPGYTHMQRAMPTTVGDWIGCYHDAMKDNSYLIDANQKLIDQSPLGTGAGYGIPVFEIDRNFCAKELNYCKVLQNPIYAQHTRPKFEASILSALCAINYDLNKFATDLVLFNTCEFGFVKLPKNFTTGSSIMPQKKNPDVLELMRAKYHIVLADELKIKSLMSNLMFGYNRDAQLTKEPLVNSIEITKSSLKIASLLLDKIEFDKTNLQNATSDELYATKRAYELAKKGVAFRDAYKQVGKKYL